MKSRVIAGLLSIMLVVSGVETASLPVLAADNPEGFAPSEKEDDIQIEIEESLDSKAPGRIDVNTAESDFERTIKDGEVTITKYKGLASEVLIPPEIGGAPVVAIGENAFKDNDIITFVKLPQNLKSIGEYAFYECSNLESVDFNDGLETTAKYSFGYCTKLKEAILPTSLTKLGDQVFAHCTSLTKVFIPKGLDDVYLAPFRACPLETIEFEEGIERIPGTTRGSVYHIDGIFGDSGIEEVVIPDTVTIIGDDAFHDCAKLKKVTLPEKLKEIQGYAFADCTSLEEAILPEGIEKVEDSAYRGCSSLNEVFLPKTLTEIQDRAFYETTALKKVTFEEGTTTIFGTNPIYQDIGVFAGSGLETITLPDSVTKVEGCAFAGCKELKEIKLSPNITSIGAKAFYNCEKLDGVVLPEGITVIQDRLFYNCASLSTITIPSQVTEIQELAFKGCSSLKSIYIPKNVATIEKEAFMDDTSLKAIEFEVHNLYTTKQILGENAFNGCASLTDVQLGNRITELQKGVFAGCTALKEIQIPYGVDTIKKGAFSKCHNLEILFVPSSVTIFETTDDEFERSYTHEPLVYYEKDNVDVKIYATALGWDTEVGIWNVDYADPDNNEFPDKNLNKQLYEQGIDKNIDTRLTLREIEAAKELNAPDLEIEDATGIQLLTSLEKLDLSGNKIATFNLNGENMLAGMTELTSLNVAGNRLFALDLSSNKKLSDLTLGQQNAVGTLSSNEYFENLLDLQAIYGDQYNKSSVKNITDPYLLQGEEATAEKEGIAWEEAYHVPDIFSYEYVVNYGSGATKTMTVEATLTNAGLTRDSKELAAAYPDGNFRTAVFAALDTNKNDKLSRTEERTARILDVKEKKIESIEGVERFWNLEELYLDTNKIAKVDLKNNKKIKELYVGGNALAAIDTSVLTALESFRGGNQSVSFDGEKKDHVRTIDVKAYDSSFAKENVSEVKALDAEGNETDKVITVTDTGFSMAGSVPAFMYTYAATKGNMKVNVKITGELDPDDSEPAPEVKKVTVKFSIDGKMIKATPDTLEAGDTIADIVPEAEDVEALIPKGNSFTGWFVENTENRWDIATPVYQDLSLVGKYVKDEDILEDDDDGRDPGLKPTDGGYDEKTGIQYFDAYMVKGQTCAFPITYGDLGETGDKANEKITWKSSDDKKVSVSGKYKVKAKKATADSEVVQIYDGNTIADSKYIYKAKIVSPRLIRTDGATAAFKSGTITIGNSITLGIDGLGSNEKYADFYNISWYSSNEEVARVDDAGIVTGYAKGTAKISAYINGKAYTGKVSVVEKASVAKKLDNKTRITLTPLQNVSLKFKDTNFKVKKLTWYVVKSDDTLVPMKGYDSKGEESDTKISYYRNNVVKVTPAGKLTAIGVGTTALAAKDANGAVQYVTVSVSSPVTNTVYLNVGKKKTIKYYNVKGAAAVWSSSKPAVTGGNCSKGKVIGAQAGTATITCKYDPCGTGYPITYKTLVIVEDPKLVVDKAGKLQLIGSSASKAKLELSAGERYAINANLKNQSVIFTSSKADIAFVNDAGVIIARKPGKTTITAKINGKTLAINLTVK